MKKVIFLATLFFLAVSIFGLMNFNNLETTNSSPIIVAITPPNNIRSDIANTDDIPDKDKEVEKILGLLNSAKSSKKESIEFLKQEVYNEVKYLTQKSQLTDLKKVELSENDKEIRIWNTETLFSAKTKGYIFTFINRQWQGMFVIDVGKKHRFKKIYYEEPLSGWKNWETFVENEITPTKVENSNSQPGGTDGLVVVIEVKFGQKYAKNIFCDPSMNEDTIDKIFKKIKTEFYNDKIKWSEF